MSDSFWFFPKQQNTMPETSAPAQPVIPAMPPISQSLPSEGMAPSQEAPSRSLEDALSEIAQEADSVSTAPVEHSVSSVVAPEAVSSTTVSHARLELLKHSLEDVKKNVQKALDLLGEELSGAAPTISSHTASELSQLVPGMAIDTTRHTFHASNSGASDQGNVVEGMFDGQAMIGPDGKQYSVPPNYASKSKLVEGDVLKLTIAPNGSFIYKQIGPIARRRVMGILEQDSETHTYVIKAEGQTWRVLTASVTYFKGMPGDEVVILVPQDKPSKWGAVENIIKKF